MTEAVTYIRCQINGKWTNLGIVAEEDEIKEHFDFVENLLNEKQRADELQKQLNEKSEGNKSLLNRIDELTTVIGELHISNSGFCEQAELSKLRADRLEYHIKRMRDNYVLMSEDSKRILKNDTEDKVLKALINIYDDVAKELNAILEEDGE